MPATRIVVVCAGSQGAIVADILQRARDAGAPIAAIGFVDDTRSLGGSMILGLPVLGTIAALHTVEHDAIVVAVGDNRIRRAMTARLLAAGEQLATAVHPFASVAPSAHIGEGSMISAGAIVLPRATIGRGVLLNTKASVDHDSVVGDFAHIGPGATVGAHAQIGEEMLVALGASVPRPGRSGRAR